MAAGLKRIATWNIRHGGGAGARRGRVIAALLGFDADVLVVTEFRASPQGKAIVSALQDAGYATSHPPADPSRNTVLIASRAPILRAGPLGPGLPDGRHLWLADLGWVSLCGVYMPLDRAKLPYWDAVLRARSSWAPPDLVVGDFNTGRNDLDRDPGGSPFIGADYMDRMAEAGWTDVWRHRFPERREFSWYSPQGGNGFRLDHVFASTDVARFVAACRYEHGVRTSCVSDHSALFVELIRPDDAPATAGASAAASRVTVQAACSATASRMVAAGPGGTIYAFQDDGRPDLVKIGKDQKWPQRFRQAQSHTPREMRLVAQWCSPGATPAQLAELERRALRAFDRGSACDGAEWVRSSATEASCRLRPLLGQPSSATESGTLAPYDDWRDFENPRRSQRPRRLWVGVERTTGRLKVVHSPHDDRFFRLCPTYNCFGLRWTEAWEPPADQWSASHDLHPLDRRVVELWRDLVDAAGYGAASPRVGWLREGATVGALRAAFARAGLRTADLAAMRPPGLTRCYVAEPGG